MKDQSGDVKLTLKNQNLLSDYDVLNKSLNNLFGYESIVLDGKEVTADAKGNPTADAGAPRLKLENKPTEVRALQKELTTDGKPLWKNAEYGTTKCGYVLQAKGNKTLSYCFEPVSPTKGIIHFKVYMLDDQSFVKSKDVAYEIGEDYRLNIDMTDFDPHGLGSVGQYQTVSADVNDKVVGDGRVYQDGEATLTLEKLGEKPNTDNKESYRGGKLTLVDGEVTLSGYCDFVATAQNEGKLFIKLIDLPEASRYIIGEYLIIDAKCVLVFTVNSKIYLFNNGELEPLYAQVKGEYFGVEDVEITHSAEIGFTSISSGTIKQNGLTFRFVINNGRVSLTYVKDGQSYIVVKK